MARERDEVDTPQKDETRLEVTGSKITLPYWLAALIALVIVGAVEVRVRVAAAKTRADANTTDIRAHVALPGHPVLVNRVDTLEERVEETQSLRSDVRALIVTLEKVLEEK